MSALLLWAGVAGAGGAASVARLVLGGLGGRPGGLPWGTLAVNLSGSFILGLMVGLGLRGEGYLVGATAVVGSYTTFSRWMLDSRRLAGDGRRAAAAANLAVSLLAGVGALALGRMIGA